MNQKMKKILFPIVLVLFLLARPATAQVDSLHHNSFAVNDTQSVRVILFQPDSLFEISLKFDITAYKRAKSDEEYLPAVLTYFSNGKDSINKNIRVRARGNIRRTTVCDFPPLMLNFKIKDTEGQEFEGINKLKIVPYCKLGYEKYILKEYLIYKLYNVMTDYSLRVRLFKINYINTAKLDRKPLIQYGFAIEPIKIFENRTATKEITYPGVTQRSIRSDMLDLMAVFNYMIGNTDWSVPIRHNVVLLTPAVAPQVYDNIIVPFDFDYAGLVNTDYAIPYETLPIKTVTERLYMAVCRSEESFNITLKKFIEKKKELYKVITDFPYLSSRSKKEMTDYLDSFFYGIENRNTIVKRLLGDCLWFEQQSKLRVR